jgi:hypothetical protein
MHDHIIEFKAKLAALEKHIKSKDSKTISDEKFRSLIQDLMQIWRIKLRSFVLEYRPQTSSFYEFENLMDKMLDGSTKPCKRPTALRDVRDLKRRFQKDVENHLIKVGVDIKKTSNLNILINPDKLINPRRYLVETIRQVNITYTSLCPDACALLLRRLVEFMIYDYYKNKKRESELLDSNGDIKSLKKLINQFIDHSGEKISGPLKDFLKNARIFGGTAAHNIHVILDPADIDRITSTADICLREFFDIVY